MNSEIGHDAWIDAGLRELGHGGITQVRVEVLAQRLGVTKGGFYRRFKDRRALLDALLETWTRGRIAANEQQIALGDASAAQGVRSIIRLYTERDNPEGMAIELAIRQWARSDTAAANAVARVDAARLQGVAGLFVRMGLSRADAEAHAFLFYAFIFGQSLISPHQPPRERAALMAACADVLTSVTPGG